MGVAIPGVVTGLLNQPTVQVIDGSLNFDGSYLKRTPGTIGNRKTFTWSAWVKLNETTDTYLFSVPDSGGHASFMFDSSGLRWNTYTASNGAFESSAKFRDIGGWYHIVFAFDSTQETTTNRIKVYVNGEQKASSSYTAPTLSTSTPFNDTVEHSIGARYQNATSGDFALSNNYFIDGQALGPESFGFTDPLTNTWRPKKYTTGAFEELDKFNTYTFGENQFQLKYQGIKFPSAAGGTVAWRATGSSTTGLNLYTSTDNANWTRRLTNQTVDSTNGLVYESSDQYVILVNGTDATWSDQLQMFSDVNGATIHYSNGTYPGNGNPTMSWSGPGYTDGTIASYNSFYFPFDGNSPIGEDKSGKGNDFTPNGFGNTNKIDSPDLTGGTPILNTNEAGTVALPGYFGQKEYRYYTVSSSSGGGNPYIIDDVGTQPTFSFVRGAKYVFDYSSASGHPLRFATAADAAGSTQYTTGTVVSGNTITFTVPHDAPSTLYYYCTNHNGMGNSISVTTDTKRADPYAQNLVCALPLVGEEGGTSFNGVEWLIRSTSYTAGKSFTAFTGNSDGGGTTSKRGSVFYGSGFYTTRGATNANAGDYIERTGDADLSMGTGDYTIEFWFHPYQMDTNDVLIDTRHPTTDWPNDDNGIMIYINANGDTAMVSNGVQISGSRVVGLKQDNHFALTREGTTERLFVNGNLIGTATNRTNDYNRNRLHLGSSAPNGEGTSGYYNDLRVYKGVAKYTSSFKVGSPNPTVLPDTPSGVSGSSKLTKITDGAVTFDGTDYLTVADGSNDFSFGTGAYTVEGYLYPTTLTGNGDANPRFFCCGTPSASSNRNQLQIVITASGQIRLDTNSANYTSTTGDVVANRWQHIAVARDGSGNLKAFVNGRQVISETSVNNDITNNDGISLGIEAGYSSRFTGFMSNVRILKGTALYTSAFTPPERTLTNITNTKLLCCQSNTSATAATVTPGTITVSGDSAPTTFNPFNTSINAIRGQETGYCTANPLDKGALDLSNGNLRVERTSDTTDWETGRCTIKIPDTGRWYWEMTLSAGSNDGIYTGVGLQGAVLSQEITGFWGYNSGGYAIYNTSYATSPPSMSVGDTACVSFDRDNNRMWVLINGATSVYDGNPHSGTDPNSNWTNIPSDVYPVVGARSTGVGDYNFGQKPFKFPPPDGFQPLNGTNLIPETVIARSDQYVDVTTYTATNTSDIIKSDLKFQPDFLWIKPKASGSHTLTDSVRGVTMSLKSDSANAQEERTGSNSKVKSFNYNGFTIGTNNDVNNSGDYVAWSWKAGGNKNTFNVDDVGYASAAAAGLDGGNLNISGASVGTKQGFSIITLTFPTYTGTGTIDHGLNSAPTFWMMKDLGYGENWFVGHKDLGADKYLYLNLDNSKQTSTTIFDNTLPTSTLFYTNSAMFSNVGNYVMYLWHNVPGLQKFGTYEGNSSTDGPYIELGFRPAVIMVKNADNADDWVIADTTRSSYNPQDETLFPNRDIAEDTGSFYIDVLSNGFKPRHSSGKYNSTGHTFIYAAWAESPSFNLYGGQSNAR